MSSTPSSMPSRRRSHEQKNIEVRGFGTFKIRQRKTRMARNPRTGSPVEVSARPVPVFKPSKELRTLVADADEALEIRREGGRGHCGRGSPARARISTPAERRANPAGGGVSSPPCRFHVLLFASYADAFGARSVTCRRRHACAVADVVARCVSCRAGDRPAPTAARRRESALRASRHHGRPRDDEVAIIPPVAGG